MYALINGMTESVISQHRTLAGAARKARSVQPRETGHYLPVRLMVVAGAGVRALTESEQCDWHRAQDGREV